MNIMDWNEQSFREQTAGERPVLVEFSAPWCVYCRRIAPVLERVAQEYADTLSVGHINIDNEPELARQEQIEVVPTLIVYRAGKALGSIVAPESRVQIDELIRDALNG
jgi:thioredoxin